MTANKVEAIDLFCGIGGLSYGLQRSGITLIAGFDIDATCKRTYERNIKANFYTNDLCNYDYSLLESFYSKDSIKVLAGCAPCQPFSSHAQKKKIHPSKDSRYHLLGVFSKCVAELYPDIVVMENVPGLTRTSIFTSFLETLQAHGYHTFSQIIYCPDYGIPQKRKRLIVLASRLGDILVSEADNISRKKLLAGYVLRDFPEVAAGGVDANDSIHRAASLTDINLKRIQASRPGGTWQDWSEDLRPACYQRKSGASYSAMYGRIDPNEIAPTITTKFTNYGSGRFGHPYQDRALTLREGATIQTFPRKFRFDQDLPMSVIARHIGNAVPPKLGTLLGNQIMRHLSEVGVL